MGWIYTIKVDKAFNKSMDDGSSRDRKSSPRNVWLSKDKSLHLR